MAFTNDETAQHLQTLERCFWAYRRPPQHLRDQIRDGQRLDGQSIELFFIRPLFADPSCEIEEAIAKIRFVRSTQCWKLYWKRADNKWHGYHPPHSEMTSLEDALEIVLEDEHGCFFG